LGLNRFYYLSSIKHETILLNLIKLSLLPERNYLQDDWLAFLIKT